MEQLIRSIREIAVRHPEIQKVVLFGSRARGDHKPNSDMDLAVFGKRKIPLSFLENLEEIETLLKLDVTIITESTSMVLQEHIQKEGRVIMERPTKAQNLQQAVERLREAIELCASSPTELHLDGLIQRFEFCTELAWKSCKEKLEELGYCEVNGPKPVMREAFSYGLIDNEEVWLAILTDRNRTSHLYDSTVAREISDNISTLYDTEFEKLVQKLLED